MSNYTLRNKRKKRSTKKNKKVGGKETSAERKARRARAKVLWQQSQYSTGYPDTIGVPLISEPPQPLSYRDLIFNERFSIWRQMMPQPELELLKLNLLRLINNRICKNITDNFNFFNSNLDGKKINTECYLLIIIGVLSNLLKPYCKLIIKGGLAVQLSLTKLFKENDISDEDAFNIMTKNEDTQTTLSHLFKFNSKHDEEDEVLTLAYSTNDIDLLIEPLSGTGDYYALEIENMLMWIFQEINSSNENLHILSTQDKTKEIEPSKRLLKVSISEPSDARKPKFTAVMDINITLPEPAYYMPVSNESFELKNGLHGEFNFVSVDPLIMDRLSHIIKYKGTVSEMVSTIPSLVGATKLSDIFGGHPDFKYLTSVHRSLNALIDGLLIVEIIKKENIKPLVEIKDDILNEYVTKLGLEEGDAELIRKFVLVHI